MASTPADHTVCTVGGETDTMIDTETDPIDNSADIIDSRDVIARIEALRSAWAETTGDDPDDYALSTDDWQVGGLDEGEAAEIVALLALARDAIDYASDWQWGATLIRHDHFEDYARDLADDLGLIPSDASWPATHIDWSSAADALRIDYTSVEFDGVTYYVR